MKSKVVLLPCDSYDEEKVYAAVKQGFELLGGVGQFVKADEKVLVKTNLLMTAPPEKAMTTHPAVFGAVLRCLHEFGCNDIKYGDSPGNPLADMKNAYKVCGFKEQGDRYGAVPGNFGECKTVDYPEGKRAKSFAMCAAPQEADSVIEVCKMKTHALENITGAVKNQYGFIYSANKALGHAKYPNSRIFAEMLVDLNKCIGLKLHVMDGIVAMEGNGPSSGNPTNMNVILMSADPVALDTVFARLVYLDPSFVPTCTAGEKYGLGTMTAENITLLTPDGEISLHDAAKKYGNPDFDVERKKAKFWNLGFLKGFFKKYNDKPVVDLDKCIACGVCHEACPVEGGAVQSGKGKKAVYDYKKCIRCYCCQEMCPAKAITKQSGR